MTKVRLLLGAAGALTIGGVSRPAHAQWSTAYESFYLPGSFNWQFRHNYPPADRLFNAFDFGHAILYETLWAKPNAPIAELEEKWYDRLTKEILVNPPRLPLEEAAVEIEYAKLAPEAKAMFDWAHLLHRQIYDVWADERLSPQEKDAEIARLIRYYKTRPDVAFSSKPKTMELMERQPYSLAFRKAYPKFNGLIWAYHWLQVGLYEPLLVATNKDERQTGVLATVARFRQMIENPPTWMPRVMPMTAAVAPTFAARYPEAAIIFDNLHSMHDVISDILANASVPRDEKRAAILTAAGRYRDDTSYVMTVSQWREMADMMGVNNMGGPSVGFLPGFPTPTVERGAVMSGMDHRKMGHATAAARGSDTSHAAHRDTSKAAAPDHVAMGHAPAAGRAPSGAWAMSDSMMAFAMRVLSDSGISSRIVADTVLFRQMKEIVAAMPTEHRAHMEMSLNRRHVDPHAGHVMPPPAKRSEPPAKPSAGKAPARQAPPKQVPAPRAQPTRVPDRSTTRPAEPHAEHKMPSGKTVQRTERPAAPKSIPKKPAAKKDTAVMDHSKMPGMKKP